MKEWAHRAQFVAPGLLLVVSVGVLYDWPGWWPFLVLVWLSGFVAGTAVERYWDYTRFPGGVRFKWWWGPRRMTRAVREHIESLEASDPGHQPHL